jgi:uncharacterized phiE125 gp8 family phage protein
VGVGGRLDCFASLAKTEAGSEIMIEGEALILPPEAAGAAKAYLRVERSDEDGLIAGLVAAAAELCEAFIGAPLLVRGFSETIPPEWGYVLSREKVRVPTIPAGGGWRRLTRAPVRAITLVEAIPAEGAAQALPGSAYGVDIDAAGDGWVRVTAPGEARSIRIGYQAGLAAGWAELPAGLRQGILRLAAHFYTNRATESARPSEPPAAVTALWRPYRRIRLR